MLPGMSRASLTWFLASSMAYGWEGTGGVGHGASVALGTQNIYLSLGLGGSRLEWWEQHAEV